MSANTILPKVHARRGLRLIYTLVREYPRLATTIIVLMFISGIAEGAGIAAVMPLLNTLQDGAAADDRLSRAAFAVFGWFDLEPTMPVLVLTIVVLMSLKAVLVVVAMRQVGFAMAKFGYNLRDDLLKAIVSCRWSYFTRQPMGELANAMTAESHRAVGAFWAATNFITLTLQIVVYLVLSSMVSWAITAGAIFGGGVLFLLLHRFVLMARRGGEDASRSYSDLARRLVDGVSGIKSIKAMAKEDRLGPMLEADNEMLLEAQKKLVISKESLTALQEPVIVILMSVGLLILSQFQDLRFEVLIMMALLFQRLVSKVGRLQSAYQALLTAEGYHNRLQGITRSARAAKEMHKGTKLVHLSRGVELSDLSFSYGEGVTLRNVSLRIPTGRTVTVFGPSGAGKSTLVDLIVGLQSPTRGEILVDGVSLSDLDMRRWRSEIGYVPQELFLFHESIRNNVTFGDASIPDQVIEEALAKAGAWGFISELPQGLETVVGERGAALSGGQRQRVALARALVRQPRLLILDEPTTALDPATEAEICETLRGLKGQVTILAISHQRALVDLADIVYEFDRGQLVGTVERSDDGTRPTAAVS